MNETALHERCILDIRPNAKTELLVNRAEKRRYWTASPQRGVPCGSAATHPASAMVDRWATVCFHHHQLHRSSDAQRFSTLPQSGKTLDQYRFRRHHHCVSHLVLVPSVFGWADGRSAWNAAGPGYHRGLVLVNRHAYLPCRWIVELSRVPIRVG